MFDPELKYCPECKDEYRADIELCASCGVMLLAGREMLAMEEAGQRERAGRAVTISPDDDIVTIHSGPLQDIKQIENLLRAEGINSLVAGDDQSCGKGCCPSTFSLLVRREDAPESWRIIESEHARATALAHHDTSRSGAVYDADAGEATCPACGHAFSTSFTSCPDCGLHFG